MTKWVAVSFGALDVTDDETMPTSELLVTPVVAAQPRALFGEGASLWRRLVAEGPLDSADLDDDSATILDEMHDLGLVSNDVNDEARVTSISAPWLTSSVHELVYGLVASLSRRENISIVFIKGPMLQRQGLRDRAHSGDVDVWVEPGRQHALAAALSPWGWSTVPFDFAEEMYHSVTLEPDTWGCEVDVHFRFPGIGEAPDAAFRTLLAESEIQSFAGIGCHVPATPAGAVIYALHSLRPDPKVTVTDKAHAEAQAALRVGAGEALRVAEEWRALPVLGHEFSVALPEVEMPAYDATIPADWARRGASTVARYHLATVCSLPWRRRPAAVWHVLWPSGRTARLSASRIGHPDDSPLIAHLRRLVLGVRQLFGRGR